MSTVVLPNVLLELACCHLIAMTDMKNILLHEGKLWVIDDNRPVAKPASGPRTNDSGLDSAKVNCSHIEMMTKAINILKRENLDPNQYRYALAKARTLSDHERTSIAISSQFFNEMVPEEALVAIVGCVDME